MTGRARIGDLGPASPWIRRCVIAELNAPYRTPILTCPTPPSLPASSRAPLRSILTIAIPRRRGGRERGGAPARPASEAARAVASDRRGSRALLSQPQNVD